MVPADDSDDSDDDFIGKVAGKSNKRAMMDPNILLAKANSCYGCSCNKVGN